MSTVGLLLRPLKRCAAASMLFGVLVVVLPAGGGVSAQELAYLRSLPSPGSAGGGAQGNAWLFRRGGECFALTPKHVLINAAQGRDDHYAQIVVVRPGREPVRAQADRCALFGDEDLALMRVSGVADIADCGHVMTGVPNLDSLLETTSGASLLTATESGRFERSTLEIRAATAKDSEHFWVAPVAGRDRLTEGMSGGLVTIQDQLGGFLLAVGTASDGPTAGMARVFRADRAAVLVTRAFEGAGAAVNAQGNCTTFTPPAPMAATAASTAGVAGVAGKVAGSRAPANRAAAECGTVVAGWSASALSQNDRPENLAGAAGADGRWRAAAVGEITVDLRLCPVQEATVSRVAFSTVGCGAGDNGGLDVEVLVRAQSTAQFVSLGFGAVPQDARAEFSTGAPLIGREIRLRFVPRGSGPHTVCLGGLSVD